MRKSDKHKVLVVEDQAVVVVALGRLLNRQKDLSFCGAVDTVAGIIPAIEARNPDVLLLDLFLHEKDSAVLIPTLVSKFPDLRVLVFSQLDGVSHAESILKAGAHGFITKAETLAELLTAIRTVLNREIFLSRKMAALLLHRFVEEKPSKSSPGKTPALPLTRREMQVFELIGTGKKTSQIATTLTLSVKTVETHRENIKRKLGIANAPELMLQAVQWVESRVPTTLVLKKSN